MRKCDKIIFDQVPGKRERHQIYQSLLAEEIKMKHKNR